MPIATLEEIRLLSNLETRTDKLLQIVMFGQPELDENLRRPNIRQLRDRIAHSFRLEPLTTDEVREYLTFRMRAAGYRGPEIFSSALVKQIARASNGLTRRVNLIADKALLAAFSENTHTIQPRIGAARQRVPLEIAAAAAVVAVRLDRPRDVLRWPGRCGAVCIGQSEEPGASACITRCVRGDECRGAGDAPRSDGRRRASRFVSRECRAFRPYGGLYEPDPGLAASWAAREQERKGGYARCFGADGCKTG
jgi:hypothetical protein